MKRNQMERVAPRRLLLGVACTALIAIVIVAPAAFAQSATDQYDPTLDAAGIVQSGSQNAETQGERSSGAAGEVKSGETSGGGTDLPFTGYPLTPLVGLIGLLLAAGLVVRLVVPALGRRTG